MKNASSRSAIKAGPLLEIPQERHLKSGELSMTTRWAKLSLLAGIALYYVLIVFGNLTDFDSNYQFVRHTLLMDSTFPANHGMWRAIQSPALDLIFYWTIILWEIASTILLCWGLLTLIRAAYSASDMFNARKRIAIVALTLSALMWLVAFLDIGGEWFLMWQSSKWNGQEEAFRMFVVVCIVLLFLIQRDAEPQP
jgi:predicted small integral membrane protein